VIEPGLDIELLWWDEDVNELRIRASNGTFAGEARVYVRPDGLESFAATLDGFPRSVGDRREIELGTFDPNMAGGGARALLWKRRATGPADAEITLWAATVGRDQSVSMKLAFEPAAIDEFVRRLRSLTMRVGDGARLPACG